MTTFVVAESGKSVLAKGDVISCFVVATEVPDAMGESEGELLCWTVLTVELP